MPILYDLRIAQVVLVLLFFHSVGHSQTNSPWQIEVGVENYQREISGALALIYQYQGLQFKVRATQDFASIGSPTINHLLGSNNGTRDEERYKYKYTASMGWAANFQFLRPLLEIGAGYRPDVIYTGERKENEVGLFASAGFLVRNFHFAYNYLANPIDGWGGRQFFELGYRIGLTKKQSLPKKQFLLFFQERELQVIRSRIYFGNSIDVPMVKQFNGGARRFYVGFEKYFKHFLLGIQSQIYSASRLGRDREFENRIFVDAQGNTNENIIINTNSEFFSWSVYYRRISMEKRNTQFEYGGGFKFLHFNPRTGISRFLPDFYQKQQNIVGLVLQGKIRYGMFSNGIDLNIPFGELKPYIAFSWNVGLNFRRKMGILGYMQELSEKQNLK